MSNVATVIAIMVAVIGRCHKNSNEPSEINKARRRFSSSIPPRIKPSNSGASGKFNTRKPTAIAPMITIIDKSTVLNDTRYTPINDKNKMIGVKNCLGISSNLAI